MHNDKEKLVELIEQHCLVRIDVLDCTSTKDIECSECLADHLIENGVTVQEWISVKDRLPERNEDGTVNAVLVTNGSIQHIAYLAKDVFYFTENGEMKEPMFYEVTHWQYLPKPPKGE